MFFKFNFHTTEEFYILVQLNFTECLYKIQVAFKLHKFNIIMVRNELSSFI